MATNTITINFEPCLTAPSAGYRVKYRPVGSEEDYRIWPTNFFSSPAVIVDANDPEGTSYEGTIAGDCGNDQYGGEFPWTADNPLAPSEPGGGEESDEGGGPSPTYYPYECEVYSCSNCSEPSGTIVAQSTNQFLTLFKYYKAQFGGAVVYRPIATSAGVAADNIIGFAYDTCILACNAPPPIES